MSNSAKENSFLKFIFDEMWSKELTREMISATLSDFVDVASEDLFDVDLDQVSEKIRTFVLKGLEAQEKEEENQERFENMFKEFDEQLSILEQGC